MYVGTYTDGADTYYTAYYYIDSASPEAYVRIDAKNITRDQFIGCIAKNTYQYRIQDHWDCMTLDGTAIYTGYANGRRGIRSNSPWSEKAGDRVGYA